MVIIRNLQAQKANLNLWAKRDQRLIARDHLIPSLLAPGARLPPALSSVRFAILYDSAALVL